MTEPCVVGCLTDDCNYPVTEPNQTKPKRTSPQTHRHLLFNQTADRCFGETSGIVMLNIERASRAASLRDAGDK